MKYMLLMQFGPRTLDVPPITEWRPEEVRAHIDFMASVNGKLAAAGELVDAQGLAMPDSALIVRAAADGTPVVTDGPFAETKEFLAGWWIVEVPSRQRALEIAAGVSAAPAPPARRSTCRSRSARSSPPLPRRREPRREGPGLQVTGLPPGPPPDRRPCPAALSSRPVLPTGPAAGPANPSGGRSCRPVQRPGPATLPDWPGGPVRRPGARALRPVPPCPHSRPSPSPSSRPAPPRRLGLGLGLGLSTR
ncbi:YciI family protein [Streptomyces diastatochromogenes]|nr:YciI family protein [Streptomyces diastatochromogenes]